MGDQVVDSRMLEMINLLLSSAQIPGLFDSKELDQVLAPLKELHGQEGMAYRTVY